MTRRLPWGCIDMTEYQRTVERFEFLSEDGARELAMIVAELAELARRSGSDLDRMAHSAAYEACEALQAAADCLNRAYNVLGEREKRKRREESV